MAGLRPRRGARLRAADRRRSRRPRCARPGGARRLPGSRGRRCCEVDGARDRLRRRCRALDGVSFDRRRRAASPRSSAPTAPGRRPCCARCRGWSAPAPGRIRPRGARPGAAARRADRPPRHGARARGARRHRRADRRGEPAPGRAVARRRRPRRPGPASTRFPAAGRAPAPRRRSTLSGGERQMLVIGRALMAKPGSCCSTSRRWGWRRAIVAQIMALLARPARRHRADRPARRAERPQSRCPSPTSASCSASAGSSPTTTRASLAADDALRHAYLGF